MNMKRTVLLKACLSLFLLFTIKAYSQSAVAFCKDTYKTAWAYNCATEQEAIQKAIEKCKEEGGKSPVVVASTSLKGYGAVYVGDNPEGEVFIGTALACSSASDADRMAKAAMDKDGEGRIDNFRKVGEFLDPRGERTSNDSSNDNSNSKSNLYTSTPIYKSDGPGTDYEALAEEAYAKKDFPLLEQHAYKAITIRASHRMYMLLAYALAEQGNFKDAYTTINYEIVERKTDDYFAFIFRADIGDKINKPVENVLQDYTTAIEKGAKEPGVFKSRAKINYYSIKNYDAALFDLHYVLREDDKDKEAYELRGFCYLKKNDNVNAEKDFTKAIELGKVDSQIFLDRGEIYFEEKKYDEAEKDLTRAVEVTPKDFEAWHFLGRVLSNNKKYDAALEAFTKSVTYFPDYADSYLYRGQVYKILKKSKEADEDFKKALELNPDLKNEINKIKRSK